MVTSSRSLRFFPVLLLLFAGSGAAALIYEIVWFQLLQLVIGSSAVSLGLLLAAYMGGLCFGSIAFPRWVSRSYHPLRVYALLEIGIGVLGIAALAGVPLVGRIYLAGASEGVIGLVLRGSVAAICLLPPTILMGASLPAIARLMETTPKGVSMLGYLYGSNIAGAVFGSLLAGFYLLRVYDMAIASYTAAGINLGIALLAWLAASWMPGVTREGLSKEDQRGPIQQTHTPLVYLVAAISGLTALGAEVVWTRLLSLLLGATVYTFSIILAVFLSGLWIGSLAASLLQRRFRQPRFALALCQVLLALSIAWTAFNLGYTLPFLPVDPWLSLDPWFNFQLDIMRCAWAIFPATVLWGASFPLALAAAAEPGEDPARLAGRMYAANTAGSIIGALAFSLLLIPGIGTRACEQVMIGLSAASAVAALASAASGRLPSMRFAATSALTLVFAAGLIATVIDVPWEVIAYGRRIAPIARAIDLYDRANPTTILYRGEGINSSLLIAERAGQRHFYVSGKAEASTAILDMRLERMMGHVPALIHADPRSVLVVGFGAGITAGAFTAYPEVRSIRICELERQVPPASTAFFGPQNYNVLNDPRTRIVYDDARHYIFTTRDKFDVITTDPIHPWVKGTSTLYSKEFYELEKQHLNPGGVVAQWLPIYDSDRETIRTELATFFSVFPDGSLWSNNLKGDGFDLVLIGRRDPAPIDVNKLQQRLDRPDYSRVVASLADVGFHSGVDVLATYAGRAADMRHLLAGAQINEDMNMRLQYLAGLGLNSMAFQNTYHEILTYRTFPDGLLVGSGPRADVLHVLLPRVR